MSLLKATWVLYKESAVDAFKGLGRSMFAVLALALAFVVLAVVATLVGGFGIAGGFILALVEVAVIGCAAGIPRGASATVPITIIRYHQVHLGTGQASDTKISLTSTLSGRAGGSWMAGRIIMSFRI